MSKTEREATGAVDRQRKRWQIAEETAIALAYNGETAAVMMATPADLEDFARGFSLTEAYVESLDDIAEIRITPSVLGIVVDMKLRDGVPSKVTAKRSIAGRTGCGICGIDSLEAAMRPPKKITTRATITPEAINKAFEALGEHQPLNQKTHTVHAAAWATSEGTILLAREDVGRHNALDKLVGGLADQKINAGDGFIVMSSRCSYELVVKAAIAGVPLLATVSAPTGLALDFAYASGLTLAARAGEDVMIFAPATRPATNRTSAPAAAKASSP
jgi:FdhD protein